MLLRGLHSSSGKHNEICTGEIFSFLILEQFQIRFRQATKNNRSSGWIKMAVAFGDASVRHIHDCWLNFFCNVILKCRWSVERRVEQVQYCTLKLQQTLIYEDFEVSILLVK